MQCDPEASEAIFSNPIVAPKTTIIPIDLTHQVLASPAVQSRVLHGSDPSIPPTQLRKLFHDLLVFFASTYHTAFGLTAGPPLHDPLAVAVVLSTLNPTFVSQRPALKFDDNGGERFCIHIITDGVHGHDGAVTGQLGRSVAAPAESHGVAIPRGVDVEAFWELILECIKEADQCNAGRWALDNPYSYSGLGF